MFFALFKPVGRTHLFDQVEMMIQMGMNTAQTVQLGALKADVTGPAAGQLFALNALPYGATGFSAAQAARCFATQVPDVA